MSNSNLNKGRSGVNGSGGGGSSQLKIIFSASDFPTLEEANASVGKGYYLINNTVTDDDPTKTNTGRTFSAGSQIAWNGEDDWILYNNSVSLATDTTAGIIEISPNTSVMDTDGKFYPITQVSYDSVFSPTSFTLSKTDPWIRVIPATNISSNTYILPDAFALGSNFLNIPFQIHNKSSQDAIIKDGSSDHNVIGIAPAKVSTVVYLKEAETTSGVWEILSQGTMSAQNSSNVNITGGEISNNVNINYLGDGRTNATTTKAWMDRVFYAKDFGVIADGTTDNTAAIEAMAQAVDDLGGGTIIYPQGVIGVGSKIDIDNLSYPQQHAASNPLSVIFKFLNSAVNVGSLFEITNSDDFGFNGVIIDPSYSTISSGLGGHGISAYQCNDFYFKNSLVIDWKDTAVLVYCDNPGVYTGGNISDSYCVNSSGNANNGFSFAGMWNATYCNAVSIGTRGSPGYGIQFKNDCRNSRGVNVCAINATGGVAFGQTTSVGAYNIQIQGQAIGCQNGFIAGFAVGCNIDMVVDMQLQGAEAVFVTNFSRNNTIRLTANNVNRSFNAVRIDASSNNVVMADSVTGANVKAFRFGSGSSNNFIDVKSLIPYDATKTITGISQSNPATVTSASHLYSNGNIIYIQQVVGMTEINGGYYIVAGATTNTYNLTKLDGSNVDSTAYGIYLSGGISARQSAATTTNPLTITTDSSANKTNQLLYKGMELYAQAGLNTSLPSASTLDLTSVGTSQVSITGTGVISSVTLPEGNFVLCKASGSFTITNGASLITSTGGDIITTSGDTFLLGGEASGVVKMYFYNRINKSPIRNAVLPVSAISLSSNVITPITSINLPAGTYLVTANPSFLVGAATVSQIETFLATVAGTSTTGQDVYNTTYTTIPAAGVSANLSSPTISATITVPSGGVDLYLKAKTTFSVGTVSAFGGISAIKID